jgi:hypothetical protein
MSKDLDIIKDQLGKFAGNYGPAAIVPAVVKAVNADDTIAVIFNDDSELADCRLKSVIKAGNKVILIPVVGSVVLVGKIENSDEYYVAAVHEVSEVLVVIGTVTYSVTEAGFLFQKGTETLQKLFDDLIAQIKLIVVPTNVGPSGNPLNATEFDLIKTRVDNLLK